MEKWEEEGKGEDDEKESAPPSPPPPPLPPLGKGGRSKAIKVTGLAFEAPTIYEIMTVAMDGLEQVLL